MAKDYKHRANPQPRRRRASPSGAPSWLWAVVLLILIGFAVFLWRLRGPQPDAATAGRPTVADALRKDEEARLQKKKTDDERRAREQKEAAERRAHEMKEDAEKALARKPRFQFYAVLPEREFILPETEIKTRNQKERLGEKPAASEIRTLQAGSFKTLPEAERVKAQITLLGVVAKVEEVRIGATTWFRVKIGPFPSVAAANRTRALLRTKGIDSVVQVQQSVQPAAATPQPRLPSPAPATPAATAAPTPPRPIAGSPLSARSTHPQSAP